MDSGHIIKEERQTAPPLEPPAVEQSTQNKPDIVLNTLLIGNSILFYFFLFLPLFIGISLLSLRGLKTFYQSFPDIHFSIPLLVWLVLFLQLGLNLARFVNDFFVVKKLGKITLSENKLKLDETVIDIQQTKKITFHYKGDEYWKFPSGLLVLFALNKRHSHWLYTNPKELYDYIEIDGTVNYVQIKNASDKEAFFNLSHWINQQKPRLAFLIKERKSRD